MNPLALLLLAAAAGGGRMPGRPISGEPIRLDALLSQLQGAVNTLERVNELSRMSSNLTAPAPLPVPASAHIPVSAEPVPTQDLPQHQPQPAPSLPNIDLQSAMQTLGPILSMLSGGQNSK